jgi:acyl-CoA dehydrogenase
MSYNKAKGWMIGEPNCGMAAMFTMMNNARLGVGVQGISQAERAFQKAMLFAKNRVQGRSLISDGVGTIIDHADVRRNLLTMKALTSAARAICLDTAASTDFARVSGSKELYDRASFLTPIAKAFGTDVGCKVTDLGIQVHGGLGFIESAGASQLYRDARITTIYEGTNGIQAIDLVNRKLADGGDAAFKIMEKFQLLERECLDSNLADRDAVKEFNIARNSLLDSLNWMLKVRNMNDRYAGATAFLRAFSTVLGAYYLLKVAQKSQDIERIELAHFYIYHILPEVYGDTKSACRGSQSLYSVKL